MINSKDNALSGIRVLELCHAIAGPHCCQILADHGADVIKIEPPEGEKARMALPFLHGESVYFASHNRGKRSITLDLKTPDGLSNFQKLIASSDVLVTNYSADVPTRLGWSYNTIRDINSRLIYVHVTGFGATGEHRNDRAYDGIIQAMSGVPDLTGMPDGPPILTGTFVADHVTAYQAALATMLALFERDRSQTGAFLDVSMFDAYFATLAHDVGTAADGEPRTRSGNRVETAFSDVYEVKDGLIFIAPLGEKAWRQFCLTIGQPEWLENSTYGDALGPNRTYYQETFARWASNQLREEVLNKLISVGIPCGPVRTISEAVEAAKRSNRGMIRSVVTAAGNKYQVPGPPIQFGLSNGPRANRIPSLGEDNDEVMKELDS